jgi:hypothetical protein
MAERFTAIRGEVWDQTTMPARKLDLEDARIMVNIWRREAEACRQAGARDHERTWSDPATTLTNAIEAAVVQRKMMGWA